MPAQRSRSSDHHWQRAALVAVLALLLALATAVPAFAAPPDHARSHGTSGSQWCVTLDFFFNDGLRETGTYCDGYNLTRSEHGIAVPALHVSCSDTFTNGSGDSVNTDLGTTDGGRDRRVVDFRIERRKGSELKKVCSGADLSEPLPTAEEGTSGDPGRADDGTSEGDVLDDDGTSTDGTADDGGTSTDGTAGGGDGGPGEDRRSDTVVTQVEASPDRLLVEGTGEVWISVLANDSWPRSASSRQLSIVQAPEHGRAWVQDGQRVHYVPGASWGPQGDQLLYELCVGGSCDRATLVLASSLTRDGTPPSGQPSGSQASEGGPEADGGAPSGPAEHATDMGSGDDNAVLAATGPGAAGALTAIAVGLLGAGAALVLGRQRLAAVSESSFSPGGRPAAGARPPRGGSTG